VTEQELLAILNDREINLRRQFEQIISEIERTRDDLLVHRDQAVELVKLRETADADPDQKDKLHVSVTNAAERSRHQIGKNRTETTAVAESFQRILDELKNNRVHSTEQIEKIESLIITPLKQITESTFEDADIAVGLFSQKNDKREDPLSAIDQTTDSLNLLLAQMRKVLDEMSDLAEFHELIQGLREMINDVGDIQDKTENKQKEDVEKLKNSLKKLGI
jgi:rubrerythrin